MFKLAVIEYLSHLFKAFGYPGTFFTLVNSFSTTSETPVRLPLKLCKKNLMLKLLASHQNQFVRLSVSKFFSKPHFLRFSTVQGWIGGCKVQF